MKTIYFKQNLFEKVLSNKKTSTLRTHSNVLKNDIVYLQCKKEKIKAQIILKNKINIENIDSDIIYKEGFNDKKELMNILKEIYPNRNISNLWLIEWKLIQ